MCVKHKFKASKSRPGIWYCYKYSCTNLRIRPHKPGGIKQSNNLCNNRNTSNMRKMLFAIAILISITSIQAQLKIDGELRSRGIVNHGFQVPALKGSNTEVYLDQRTRIKLDYSFDKFSVRFTLQDARMWGGDDIVTKAGTSGNSNALGIYESWVNIFLSKNSNLKIGRQEWNYDDMRILSYRDWLTSGQSYDGLLYQIRKNRYTLDIGLSYNNNGNRQGILNNSYWQAEKLKTMNFIRFKYPFGEKTSLMVIASLSGRMDTIANNLLVTGTHGLNLMHNYGKKSDDGFLMRLSGYYQHGTDVNKGSDGSYRDISAYLLSFETGVRMLNRRVEIKAGVELISGRDYKNTDTGYNNTRRSFDMQYGAILPYYGGYMNHFIFQDSYKMGTKGGGYIDPYIKLRYSINKKNLIEASVFIPYLTSDVRAHNSINPDTKRPTGAEVDKYGNPVYWKGNLGTYLDFKYVYKITPKINVKAGMSYGWVSDIKNQMVYGYKDIANKQLNKMGQNYFGWVMFTVKPGLFNSGNK